MAAFFAVLLPVKKEQEVKPSKRYDYEEDDDDNGDDDDDSYLRRSNAVQHRSQ